MDKEVPSLEAKLTFKKMYSAYKRAAKGKKKNKEVILFDMNLATNLLSILKDIKNGIYVPCEYRKFYIYEPKEREILALPFRDRVVHQWFVEEYIKPIFVPMFIADSFACLEGKGTIYAVTKLKEYMNSHIRYIMNKNKVSYNEAIDQIYILKCDITKFFFNIDKNVLYRIIKKRLKDKELLKLIKMFIYSNLNSKLGIPIGNYTSQYFANIYLNELDHYVKEKLNIKHYIRYMDDFVMVLDDKKEAKMVLKQIRTFLKTKLKLSLNKKTMYFKLKQGVKFLGLRVYANKILLSSENKYKEFKDISYKNKIYDRVSSNKEKVKELQMSYVAWKGHVVHVDAEKLVNDIEKNSKWIWR